MAHELDFSTGEAAFAFVGNKAWHGFGNALTPDSPLEVWAEQAKMDWSVKTSPVIYEADGERLQMPDRKLYYRSDVKSALAVVSNDHRLVQPKEVLEFFRDLTSDAGFTMETAGCLFGGRKFWALAKCGKEAKIMDQDEVKPYLLLATSCDGTMATCAHFTSVRVVCNNTLRMSIGATGEKASIRAPHMAQFNSEEVKEELGLHSEEAWDAFLANINRLASKKIHRDDAIDIVAKQLKDEWRTRDDAEMNRDEMMASSIPLMKIINLFDGQALGADFKSSKGTAWGLVNAVTEYYDRHTSRKTDQSRAFERAHLTDRANFKVKVTNELLRLTA